MLSRSIEKLDGCDMWDGCVRIWVIYSGGEPVDAFCMKVNEELQFGEVLILNYVQDVTHIRLLRGKVKGYLVFIEKLL